MNQTIKKGDIIDVKITGIQPYGAFASLPDNSAGLIHISEISEKFVKSIEHFVQVGEYVKVKVLDFDEDNHNAKLSLKAIDKKNKRRQKRMHYKSYRRAIAETKQGFLPLQEAMEEWLKQGILEEEE